MAAKGWRKQQPEQQRIANDAAKKPTAAQQAEKLRTEQARIRRENRGQG